MLMRLNEIDRMFDAMDLLQRKFDRMPVDYDRLKTFLPSWDASQSLPNTNLYDAGENLEMKIEVPGIAKENLSVKIQGNYLEIRGERISDAPEGYTSHRVERGTNSFTRSFTLPSDVDSSRVEARLDNGLLTLILPKSEAAKPKRITIS